MKLHPLKIILTQLALIGLSIIFCAPFAWVISTSFKVPDKLQSAGMDFIPKASFINLRGQSTRVRPMGMKDGKLQAQIEQGPRTGQAIAIDPAALRDRVHFHFANYSDA